MSRPNAKGPRAKMPQKAQQLTLLHHDRSELELAERVPAQRVFGLTSYQKHISTELMRDQLPELADFMPDRLPISTLRKMRRDPMIQLGLHYIKMPLMSARWEIVGPDKTQAAFIQWALERVWHKVLNNMLLSLDFGFAALIKRWKYEMPPEELGIWNASVLPIIPDDIFALPPEHVQPRFTKAGKFNGVLYMPNTAGQTQEIPDQYVLWYTNELDASFGNLYGFPRIGFAHAYWRSYWFRWLLYDRHFEQDADPPVVVKGPSGSYADNETGEVYYYRDDGLAIAEAARNGGSVFLPSEPYVDLQSGRPGQSPQWSVEYLHGGENIEQFQTSFEYLDVLKIRSILVPEQALIEGKGGTSSRNVAATYSRIFAESQDVLMREIDRAVNPYLVDKIAAYNFGATPGTYKKQTESLYDDAKALMEMILTEVVKKDPKLLRLNYNDMAGELDLPLLTEEEFEAAEQRELERSLAQQRERMQMQQEFAPEPNEQNMRNEET